MDDIKNVFNDLRPQSTVDKPTYFTAIKITYTNCAQHRLGIQFGHKIWIEIYKYQMYVVLALGFNEFLIYFY